MEGIAETRQDFTTEDRASDYLIPGIPGYLTKEGAAAFLGKSGATLDRWHRLRVGPPRTKIGSSTFYREAALNAWLVAQEQACLRTGR